MRPADMGNYLGLTQGDPAQLPTLYFELGHYTQEHGDIRNVGWHSIIGDPQKYRGQNISGTASRRFGAIDDRINRVNNDVANRNFYIAFKAGQLDEVNAVPTERGHPVFFECFSDGTGQVIGYHMSRSFLNPIVYNLGLGNLLQVNRLAPNVLVIQNWAPAPNEA